MGQSSEAKYFSPDQILQMQICRMPPDGCSEWYSPQQLLFVCWVVTKGECTSTETMSWEHLSEGLRKLDMHYLSQSQPSCEEGGGRIIIVPVAVLKNLAQVLELALILIQSRNRQTNKRHFTEATARKMAA